MADLPEVLAAVVVGKQSTLRLIASRDADLPSVSGLLPNRLPQLERVRQLLARLVAGDRGSPVRRAVCFSFSWTKY